MLLLKLVQLLCPKCLSREHFFDKLSPMKAKGDVWLRLSALWALNETALGGILHALHIPLTGYLVGGMAVLCIGMMAYLSNNPSKDILQSLSLVLLLKAAVSPHSPPAAYLAVAFQGVVGALIFRLFSFGYVSVFFFAALCMLESAFQKLLMLTLVYGLKFWEAIDAFGLWLFKQFSLNLNNSFSLWLIAIYAMTYLTWAVLLSNVLVKLPDAIAHKRHQWPAIKIPSESRRLNAPAKSKFKRWMRYAMLLAFTMGMTYFFQASDEPLAEATYILLRSFAVILLLLLLQPLFMRLVRNWSERKSPAFQQQLDQLEAELKRLQKLPYPLYQELRRNQKGLKLLKEWMWALFVLTIYPPENEDTDLQ